jgi:hypothetical protein
VTTPIAPRLFVQRFTVAAGQTATAPVVLDDARLKSVRIVIPDGHAGLTALQIKQGGAPLFPTGADPFIRGNNEDVDFEWDDEVTANGLSLLGTNNDIFGHTWILRFVITDLGNTSPVVIASPQAGAPLPQSALNDIGGLSGTIDTSITPAAADLAALQLAGADSGTG